MLGWLYITLGLPESRLTCPKPEEEVKQHEVAQGSERGKIADRHVFVEL